MPEETMKSQVPVPVNETGAFVFERFRTVGKARATLAALDKQDDKHRRDRMKHKGMINGARPYNEERLKANGHAWRCNVNFREAESIRDLNAGAYWSMMNDVPSFPDLSFTDSSIDPTQAFLWSSIIGEEYTRMVRSWKSWYYNTAQVIQEFLIPGIGLMHFTDKYTWRPKAVKRENIRFKTSDMADPSALSILFIRDTMSPYDVYNAVENSASARKLGWNTDIVKQAMIRKYINKDLVDKGGVTATAAERLQQMFKNGEAGAEVDELNDLDVVWLYAREPDGMISEYLFIEDEGIQDYLFADPGKYDDITKVIVPFFYTIGDGDLGSIRGLGNRMFGMVEYSNRLMCGIMDGAWLGSSMVVQDQGGDNRIMSIERIGPITKIPASVRPIQTSFSPQFGQLAQVKSMLELMQNNNNGVQVRSPSQGMQRTTATATQYQMERDTQFTGQQVENFYIYWRILHQEMFRRALARGSSVSNGYKEAGQFIEKCVARGVPRELMSLDKMEFDIMQSIGGGSMTMRKMTTNRIFAMSQSFDEIGRQNILVDAVAAEVGYRRATRYVSNLNRNLVPTNETSIAMLENNDMAEGKPVTTGADQKHLLHSLTHLQPLTETIQAWYSAAQQNNLQDPRQLLPFWQEAVQHISEHADRMRNDPRYAGDVKMVDGALKQLVPIIKAASTVAEAQNEEDRAAQQEAIAQMQSQPSMTPEMQLKLQQMQAEIQLKAQSTKVDLQLKSAKAQQQMALKQAAADQKMQIRARDAGMVMSPQEEPEQAQETVEPPQEM